MYVFWLAFIVLIAICAPKLITSKDKTLKENKVLLKELLAKYDLELPVELPEDTVIKTIRTL